MTETNLGELLSQLRAIDGRQISFGDIVAQLEDRGYGPIMLAPALLAMLPTGAIPGVPSICGLLIALIAGQLLLGRRSPWLPKRLKSVKFSQKQLDAGIRRVLPVARRIDRLIHPRMTLLTDWPFTRIIAGACVCLGLSMIPLELIPFAAAGPAAAIVFAALALSMRDGLLLIFSMLIMAVSVAMLLSWL